MKKCAKSSALAPTPRFHETRIGFNRHAAWDAAMSEKNAPLDPASLEIPAPIVNKFQILVAGGNVRIAFAEGFQGQPTNYRSAVALTAADALELAMAILDSLPAQRNALFRSQALGNALAVSGTYNALAAGLGLDQDRSNSPKTLGEILGTSKGTKG
jgi:hypothetical protein